MAILGPPPSLNEVMPPYSYLPIPIMINIIMRYLSDESDAGNYKEKKDCNARKGMISTRGSESCTVSILGKLKDAGHLRHGLSRLKEIGRAKSRNEATSS